MNLLPVSNPRPHAVGHVFPKPQPVRGLKTVKNVTQRLLRFQQKGGRTNDVKKNIGAGNYFRFRFRPNFLLEIENESEDGIYDPPWRVAPKMGHPSAEQGCELRGRFCTIWGARNHV